MDEIKVSILICSYAARRKLLTDCIDSIKRTVKDYKYELLVNVESEPTGLENTPSRYQKLWEKSTGEYIVKADSDIWFFPGWLEEGLETLESGLFSYVGMLDTVVESLGFKDHYIPMPYYPMRQLKYNEDLRLVAGGVWFFRRDLWKQVPYDGGKYTKSLDTNFGIRVIRKLGKNPGYTRWILASHMGVHE